MGDLSTGNRLDSARSVWTTRRSGEVGMPKKRIVHQRVVRLHGPARLQRIGLRPAPGFHKCGSRLDHDWITAFRVLARVEGRWTEVLSKSGLSRPRTTALRWFRLPGHVVDGVIIELRGCGIDGGWTGWNLATGALVLEGERLAPLGPRFERRLAVTAMTLDQMPRGITARVADGCVRFTTKNFGVGFRLDRPAFSFLGLGSEEPARVATNLLLTNPVKCDQGLQFHGVGEPPRMAPAVRCDQIGSVTVEGPKVTYEVQTGAQRYRMVWTVASAGLSLQVVREGERSEQAWHSAAWTMGFSNAVAASHAVGNVRTDGETGGMSVPVWINAPGFGTWLLTSDDEAAAVRCESRRHDGINLVELKVGERPGREGWHRLVAGRHEATFSLRPVRPPQPLRRGTPAVVRRALERTYYVAPTFRADIGSLSNSGVSMLCPICMDTWSAVLPRLDLRAGQEAGPTGDELMRISIERWLWDGPGYAAGILSRNGRFHAADDEYLMTGAAALRGIGDYLTQAATAGWYREYRQVIRTKIDQARARDLDGDGLIESRYRTGVSGTGQWSTCWADVMSFGWKCAWSNAILHGALRALATGVTRFGDDELGQELETWRKQLHAAYRPAFWNEATGWLAGWRCREDRLHDYAFLPVNGAAIQEGLLDVAEGRAVLRRLLAEAERVGMPDPALGLPLNLWPVPDEDRADILQGYPFGYYQNGGRTHSQSRRLVMALYTVGMQREGDQLLRQLCGGFATASTFGGNQSGVDWRAWDDAPCGYEGLLTDQFGLLEAILWRWAEPAQV